MAADRNFGKAKELAQAKGSIDDIVEEWERAKAYTKEYLDAMPDSRCISRRFDWHYPFTF